VDFEKRLSGAINYSRPTSRKHDVDCVAAIMRLRRGARVIHLDRAIALFVTPNTTLAKVSAELVDLSAREIPPCLTDFTLTNMVWLGISSRNVDLPRKLVIAERIAALQPTETFARRLHGEVEKLLEQGTITARDRMLLLFSQVSTDVFMDLTHGDETVIADVTVTEALENIQNSIREDDRRQISELTSDKDEAREQINKLENEKAQTRDRIRTNSARIAKFVFRIMRLFVFFGGLVIGLGVAGAGINSLGQLVISICFATITALNAFDLAWGIPLLSVHLRQLETKLARFIELRLNALVN
jgi:hypothetical protein